MTFNSKYKYSTSTNQASKRVSQQCIYVEEEGDREMVPDTTGYAHITWTEMGAK